MNNNRPLPGPVREMVIKVSKYFAREYINGGPVEPLAQVTRRTANALGIGARTVSRIRKEKYGPSGMEDNELRTPSTLRKNSVTNIDILDIEGIRKHVNAYYETEANPTMKSLLASLKKANLYKGSVGSLRKVLKQIDVIYDGPIKVEIYSKTPRNQVKQNIKVCDTEVIAGGSENSYSNESRRDDCVKLDPINVSEDCDQDSGLLSAELIKQECELEDVGDHTLYTPELIKQECELEDVGDYTYTPELIKQECELEDVGDHTYSQNSGNSSLNQDNTVADDFQVKMEHSSGIQELDTAA